MAGRWTEGFELRKNSTAMAQAYSDFSLGAGSFVAGRLHGTALQNGSAITYFVTPSFGNQATWVVGFAYKRGTGGSAASAICVFDSAAGFVDEIGFGMGENAGKLVPEVFVGLPGTPDYIGTFEFAYETWYFLEFKVTINGTTGSFEYRVNGQTVLSQTGINTSDTGANFANRVRFVLDGSVGGNPVHAIDDIYILDGSGASLTDFQGDGTAEAILPTGAGNSTQWSPKSTANWEEVNDANGPDNDGTWVSTAGTGIKDTYQMGDLGFITGNIVMVQVAWNAKLNSAGSRTVRPVVRHGSTDYPGGNQNITDTSYKEQSQVYATNPGTGSAWTVSDINAVELGLEAVA